MPKNRPLLVALHHPLYSAHTFHSGSSYMKDLLEEASDAAGREPEMVLAGHVHNYQRITHTQKDGTQTSHLATGAGGYPNLRSVIKVAGQHMVKKRRYLPNKPECSPGRQPHARLPVTVQGWG